MEEQPPASVPEPVVTDVVFQGSVRRAPKYAVFVVLGIALGVLAAAVLTFAFDGTQQPAANGAVYSLGQVFGFLSLACGAIGALLGGAVAVILDRTVGSRSRAVRVDRESTRSR